jgi:hypothetical protein
MAVALVVFGIIFMIFGLPLALILLVHRYYIGSFRTLLPEGSPPTVTEGNRLLGALSFFSERWEFLRLWQLESSTGNFGFYVGRKCVIALSGDAGRKWFLDARELSFSQGYGLLFGEKKDKIDGDGSFEKLFPACLARVLRRDALIKGEIDLSSPTNPSDSLICLPVLPYLTRDTRVHLLALAKSSTRITDPFETMYNLVFQITARTVACHEVADDPKLTATVRQAVKLLHSAASPIFVLFPWIPTPSTMRRYFAGIRVWWILRKIIKKKRSNKRPVDLDTDQADALAYLLEESHSEIAVIRVSMPVW